MNVMVTGPDAFGVGAVAVVEPQPAANTPTNVDAMTNAVVFFVGILTTFLSILQTEVCRILGSLEPLVTDSTSAVGLKAFATRSTRQ